MSFFRNTSPKRPRREQHHFWRKVTTMFKNEKKKSIQWASTMLVWTIAVTQLSGCADDLPGGALANSGDADNLEGNMNIEPVDDCDGALIRLDDSDYVISATEIPLIVDDNGITFVVYPNPWGLEDEARAGLSTKVLHSDFNGNIETLYEADEILSGGTADDSDIYFLDALFLVDARTVRIARNGSGVTVLEAEAITAPIVDTEDEYMYFIGYEQWPGLGLFRMRKAGGDRELLYSMEGRDQIGFAKDGDTLYWAESETWISDADYQIMAFNLTDNSVSLYATVPRDDGSVGDMWVAEGVVYFFALNDNWEFVFSRVFPGGDIEVVLETPGVQVASDGVYYWGKDNNLYQTSFDFDGKQLIYEVPPAGNSYIGGFLVTEDHIWWTNRRCIFREPRFFRQ